MRFEPLYGLPVEEPGDVEGWSVTSEQPGALLAEAVAAELARIEADHNEFIARLASLPMRWQAGFVNMNSSSFGTTAAGSFYNSFYRRGAEAIEFEQQFNAAPAVVVLPNNADLPGFSIEMTVSNISASGFIAEMGVANTFTGTFQSRWIAVERTQ